MSTRSAISILKKDQTVQCIYCHFDGYLSHVGYTLFEHYSKVSKIKKLIKLGNISSLGNLLTEDINQPGVSFCNFYRYRSQNIEENANTYNDLDSFLQVARHDYHYDYLYLYNENEKSWYLFKNQKLVLLKDELMAVPEIANKMNYSLISQEKQLILKKIKTNNKKVSNNEFKL